MSKILSLILFALSFVLYACGPSEDHLTHFQKTGTYPVNGECVEPVAAVVIERNGRFDVAEATGSASLGIKEDGIFSTANHVIFLDTEYTLFFCGKAYKARRKLDPGVSDIGFLKIVDDFDPSTFPEPYETAESVRVGDQVSIRGIHMHREGLQKGKTIHQIIEKYYGVNIEEMIDGKLEKREFVYDDLPAVITDKEVLIPNSNVKGMDSGALKDLVLRNFSAKATKDHMFSFGGLSGGPTVNRKSQKVGINSNKPTIEGQSVLERDGTLHYYPVVTMNLLPADELKRALDRLK